MPAHLDAPLDMRLRLAALWTSTLAAYLYCDYFVMYTPGKLAAMEAGQMGPLGAATQSVLLGVAVLMLVPSLMIAGSVLLPPRVGRWANVVTGAAYTALMALIAVETPWHFYKLFAVVECLLTGTIAVLAWRWKGGVR